MKVRSILRSLIVIALATGTCSNNVPVVFNRVNPDLIINTAPIQKFHILGSGFQQSANLITQSLVGGLLTGARVLSDTDILITIDAPDPQVCGPVKVQVGNINDLAAAGTTDLFSFYAATAEFQGSVSRPLGGSTINGLATGNFNANVADANGVFDAFTDLAVARTTDNLIQIYLGADSGTGVSNATFGAPTNITLDGTTHKQPRALVSGDFNNDSAIDLAFLDQNAAGQDQLSLMLGKGDGTFSAPTSIFASADSFLTLIASSLTVPPPHPPTPTTPTTPAIGLVSINGATQTQITFFQIQADGTYKPVAAPLTLLPAGINFQAIAVGNFDNDSNGNMDIAVVAAGSKNIGFFLGQGGGVFTAGPAVTLSFAPQGLAAQDYNSDRIQDIVAFNGGDNGTFEVLLGAGSSLPAVQQKNGQNQQFLAGSITSFVGKGNFVTTGDFNGDRKPDLAVVNKDNSLGFMLSQCPLN